MSNPTDNAVLISYISDKIKYEKYENKEWYDRVYLCYQDTDFKKPNPYSAIIGFNCDRYNSFKNADYAWNNNRTEYHKLEVRHTMIPMCRWLPEIFDSYILNWKLRNMYWYGQIWMGVGYNRYSPGVTSKDN